MVNPIKAKYCVIFGVINNMNITIELAYKTGKHEELKDLYSVLYSIITYDVYSVTVTFGGIKKKFIIEE